VYFGDSKNTAQTQEQNFAALNSRFEEVEEDDGSLPF
jgi:hypothetical protein